MKFSFYALVVSRNSLPFFRSTLRHLRSPSHRSYPVPVLERKAGPTISLNMERRLFLWVCSLAVCPIPAVSQFLRLIIDAHEYLHSHHGVARLCMAHCRAWWPLPDPGWGETRSPELLLIRTMPITESYSCERHLDSDDTGRWLSVHSASQGCTVK